MTTRGPIGTRKRQLICRSARSNESRRQSNMYRPADGSSIIATDISFTNPATIASVAAAFGNISVGQVVSVIGSPLNNRTYVVETASAASITVSPAVVTSEVAGATIQVMVV
jgi:hypothetical protein